MTRPDGTFVVRIDLEGGDPRRGPPYATPDSTPLTVTVKADGENHFDFPL